MTVRVIADSTCYLPKGWARERGIILVPVQVVIAGRAYDETEELQVASVAEALRAWQPVTTSRPSPERFGQAILQAAIDGADEVVIATLSGSMSATYESAEIAAKDAPIPVRTVDSRSVAMGLGFAVTSGAAAAAAGAGADEVAAIIERRAAAAHVLFYVDTLEYLRRGGRVSNARAAVGQALQVKPILRVAGGQVEQLERVRTAGKALARLEELALAATAESASEIAVQHIDAPERAHELAERLRGRLPDTLVVEAPVGGVIGAHVGPGMVAVVVSPIG